MNEKSEKALKLVFMALICAVAAYFLYVMISYYTAERESHVRLNFSADDSNIMTSASASYVMKENEGQLIMETNEKTNNLNPEGMIGKAFEIKSMGKSVSEATLIITYSDDNGDIEEKNIKLMRIDENGKVTDYKFTLDTKKKHHYSRIFRRRNVVSG